MTARALKPKAKPVPAGTGSTTAITASDTNDWLHPISQSEPCGPNLEYDHEYAVLLARFASKTEAQYGKFVDKPEPPDWADVERDCRRLLLRSKDISILIGLARCRTRLAGGVGLREVLRMLVQVLEHYPDDVHPQRVIEGEDDPAVRANALAALADPEGLLSDVRDIILSANTAFRLTVKDVERAHAIPRAADAMPIDAVTQQLADLHAQGHAQALGLSEAGILLKSIDQWSREHLQDEAPTLTPLEKLLAPFANDTPSLQASTTGISTVPAPALAEANILPMAAVMPNMPTSSPGPDVTHAAEAINTAATSSQQREQVRAHIRIAKEWLDHNEPSSPVAILLKQAERLLGKRFAEVAQAIPADLLAKWDQEA
jgi:type VI secretion system protein ImpA